MILEPSSTMKEVESRINSEPWNNVKPMSDADIENLKKQAVDRWSRKSHYDGIGALGSPGFHTKLIKLTGNKMSKNTAEDRMTKALTVFIFMFIVVMFMIGLFIYKFLDFLWGMMV